MPASVIYVAAIMLFLGAAPLPYGYYTLLRIVATVVFVWAGYTAYQRHKNTLPWIFGITAILFNPILKIYLPKEIWAAIDIAAGLLLLATKSSIQEKSS